MIIGARLFVANIQTVADRLDVPVLILALILSPLATELPEKFNSVIWVRQRKDTLAMGNISGAMVFQSCIPVSVGLIFTPWELDAAGARLRDHRSCCRRRSFTYRSRVAAI